MRDRRAGEEEEARLIARERLVPDFPRVCRLGGFFISFSPVFAVLLATRRKASEAVLLVDDRAVFEKQWIRVFAALKVQYPFALGYRSDARAIQLVDLSPRPTGPELPLLIYIYE